MGFVCEILKITAREKSWDVTLETLDIFFHYPFSAKYNDLSPPQFFTKICLTTTYVNILLTASSKSSRF